MIGAGWIAGVFVDAVSAHTAQRITAVGARSPERAADFAARHGIERSRSDVDARLADPDVDVVYIAASQSGDLGLVRLSAVVEDPDGDDVECRWWVYGEAGTCAAAVSPSPDRGCETAVAVPFDARSGETIHVIAEARDVAARRPLVAYRRVVLTVR